MVKINGKHSHSTIKTPVEHPPARKQTRQRVDIDTATAGRFDGKVNITIVMDNIFRTPTVDTLM